MTLEEEFRTAIARSASTVRPAADPLDRLHARARRERRRRYVLAGTGIAVIVVLVAATVPFRLLLGPHPYADAGYPIDSPWTRRILDSPTRGDLAQDAAYVGALARGFEERRERFHADPDLGQSKILFVGHIPGGRVMIGAYFNDDRATLMYRSSSLDPSPSELLDGGGGSGFRVGPLVVVSGVVSTMDGRQLRYTVGVAASGCSIEASAGGVVADHGAVVRSWSVVGADGVVARDTARPEERWRVTCDGVLRYQGPVRERYELAANGPPPTSLAALEGLRGPGGTGPGGAGPAHAAVDALGRAMAANGVEPTGTVRALWSGPVPGEPATEPPVAVAILDRGAGQGVPVVLCRGTRTDVLVAGAGRSVPVQPTDDPTIAQSRQEWSLLSTAASESAHLVAVRLPERLGARAVFTDRLLVVAPPDAVRLRAGATTIDLVDGVGVLTQPWPVLQPLQLVATDANGAEMAAIHIVESEEWAVFGEPVVQDWS